MRIENARHCIPATPPHTHRPISNLIVEVCPWEGMGEGWFLGSGRVAFAVSGRRVLRLLLAKTSRHSSVVLHVEEEKGGLRKDRGLFAMCSRIGCTPRLKFDAGPVTVK